MPTKSLSSGQRRLSSRRHAMQRILGVASAAIVLPLESRLRADDPIGVRATDGDPRGEPNWDERLTLRVGLADADLVGCDDKVIQAALDYVSRLGGGTVQVLPGTFVFRNAVTIPSGVRLIGSGSETIFTKIPSETIELAADSDWYDQEITLRSSASFRVGDGVFLKAKNPHHGGDTVIKRTLVAASGNRFKLDRGLRENLWVSGSPTCSSLFPILTSENHSRFAIENLTIDGNRENNENVNGNYGGCIFLQDCSDVVIRNVETRNYNGDGISFQICHDVTVEECHSHDNADLGVHPGSGSQRPVLRRNRLERNSQGIFWCWGVKFGLAEENRIEDNRLYGISIGHNDTDNLMRKNVIRRSGRFGILFREESGGIDFSPSRNVIESNRIEDSGGAEGVAIEMQGNPTGVVLTHNHLIESRGTEQRIGIRMHPDVRDVELQGNQVVGFSKAIVDLRKPKNS